MNTIYIADKSLYLYINILLQYLTCERFTCAISKSHFITLALQYQTKSLKILHTSSFYNIYDTTSQEKVFTQILQIRKEPSHPWRSPTLVESLVWRAFPIVTLRSGQFLLDILGGGQFLHITQGRNNLCVPWRHFTVNTDVQQ